MKRLFIQPPRPRGAIGFTAVVSEPLWAETLAAHYGGDCQILDLRLDSVLELEIALAFWEPHEVYVSALTTEAEQARMVLEVVERIRPEATRYVGGIHATMRPRDFEGHHVIEGDPCWGTWPSPRRDLVRRHDYHFFGNRFSMLRTTRGCPFSCNFCSVSEMFGGRVERAPADHVLNEIATIAHGSLIGITDDSFWLDAARDEYIAEALAGARFRFLVQSRADLIVRNPGIVKAWAQAGLIGVLIGLEGEAGMLSYVGKGLEAEVNEEAIAVLRENGVIPWTCVIIHPDWGLPEFRAVRQYVERLKVSPVQWTILTPLFGTKLAQLWASRIIDPEYLPAFDTLHAAVDTYLEREVFYQEVAKLHRLNLAGVVETMDSIRDRPECIAFIRTAAKSGMRDVQARLSRPETYWPGDPLLGLSALARCTEQEEARRQLSGQ